MPSHRTQSQRLTDQQRRAAYQWAAEWHARAERASAAAQTCRARGQLDEADQLDRQADQYSRRAWANHDLARASEC